MQIFFLGFEVIPDPRVSNGSYDLGELLAAAFV